MLTPAGPRFLADAPRFVFLTGKGGVGKTSIACAAAVELAGSGASVLLVSTDPASNVGQVLGLPIGNRITPVPSVPGLSALEIDPQDAAHDYRERIVGPVRGLLPAADVALIEEQLAGACTTEIASFNEFTALLADDDAVRGFDHVVFDTAPTGHTLRLLQLPSEWTGFLAAGKGDASCLGPLAGLDRRRTVYADAVATLTDATRTRFVLVTRAQSAAVDEVERTRAELAALGIGHPYLVVNAVMPAPSTSDPLAAAVHRREGQVLERLPGGLADLPRDLVPLQGHNLVGLDTLTTFLHPDAPPTLAPPARPRASSDGIPSRTLAALVDELAEQGHGLVMTMGKGGVGKTTIAAAIAVALADRGFDVHLTTTDPAAHLTQTLAGGVPNLEVSRIDPVEETRRYREQVLARKGAGLDEAGRAGLEEDLRSPCTEEIAVFQAFSQVVGEGRRRFVVVDTAPTGHTLLLLDATGSYHRDVARQLGPSASFTTPMMRLQDPALTRVLIVTLAEATPLLEARELADDLQRAGIQPWAWVVNSCLAAAETTDPLLARRAEAELPHLADARRQNTRCVVVPMQLQEPVGAPALRDLLGRRPVTV